MTEYALILPKPKRIELQEGTFALYENLKLSCPRNLEIPEQRALRQFEAACSRIGITLEITPGESEAPIELRFDESFSDNEGYLISISTDGVEVRAATGSGMYYAVQTLIQIVSHYEKNWSCGIIEDQPDYPLRGFHFDISRGRVPKLDTLKQIIERLAHFKINQFQLYIEHTFEYQFNPRIHEGCSPITAEEIKELDQFCTEHRIEFLPSIACFGHMGRILTMPEYEHLAEIPSGKTWAELPWFNRLKGLTLDSTNPKSRKLVESMFAEILPLYESEWINVCCDETYDLGKGKGKARADEIGLPAMYFDFLNFLADLAGQFGKRIMYWGDIVRKYPDTLQNSPDDSVVMHWTYGPETDVETAKVFCDAGLETLVCPSTSAWSRFLCGINTAERNIDDLAGPGREAGAYGFLNTEWGDEGHTAGFAGSWHPAILGAAKSWNTGQPIGDAFDKALDACLYGDPAGKVSRAARQLARLHDKVTDWRVFRAPFEDEEKHAQLTPDVAPQVAPDAVAFMDAINALPTNRPIYGLTDDELVELLAGIALAEHVGEKVLLHHALKECDGKPDDKLKERFRCYAAALEKPVADYETIWLKRNKENALYELLAAMNGVITEAKDIARRA